MGYNSFGTNHLIKDSDLYDKLVEHEACTIEDTFENKNEEVVEADVSAIRIAVITTCSAAFVRCVACNYDIVEVVLSDEEGESDE